MTTKTAEGAKAGIRRVAESAGVSVSTVSRALNGYADVNPATRAKVVKNGPSRATAESAASSPTGLATFSGNTTKSRRPRDVCDFACRAI